MNLEFDYWTGSIHTVTQSLIRSVGQYTRNYKTVKVGITNHPIRRSQQHSKGQFRWKRMIVKYKTTSITNIKTLEKILIAYHWDYLKNEVAGGGGPNGAGPYYLYVLVC